MKKHCWRCLPAAVSVLFFIAPITGWAAEKAPEAMDELVALYDESSCMECHEEIHGQWKDSWHAKAVVSSLGGMHNYIEIGLDLSLTVQLRSAGMDCMVSSRGMPSLPTPYLTELPSGKRTVS